MAGDFTIISIGRNGPDASPMIEMEWRQFIADVRNFLTTQGAPIVGFGQGLSEWDNVREQYVEFHAIIPSPKHTQFRNYFAGLARKYSQDAIGYTLGTVVEANQPLNRIA
jgi:hypothetical protein